jgi:FtsZ-interacting cell division protein ZipA
MSGAEVLSLSGALGMRLNRRGVFIMSDESGAELFTIENRDSTPFIEQEMNGKEIPGITFLLDVTMVEDGIKTFNKMAGVAKQFADAMNATICDDNSLVVTDSGLDLIRKQLGQIFKLMDEQEIRPGTLVAKQLFS